MPAIRTHASRQKKPPAGFDDIRDDLEVFSIKMKDAQNAPTANVPKHQVQWPIFQIAHQRSRYVYELYYEKEAISKPLYDWLLKNGYADAMLIAKWKKQGYEKVCCVVLCCDISSPPPPNTHSLCMCAWLVVCDGVLTGYCSCAACGACKLRRRISSPRASAACRELS